MNLHRCLNSSFRQPLSQADCQAEKKMMNLIASSAETMVANTWEVKVFWPCEETEIWW